MCHPAHTILVIGCGSIGERHVRTFLGTGRARVIACDTSLPIQKQIASNYCVAATGDWQSLLQQPDITGVVIATPAPSHVAIARRWLEAGRHVLIEKPLALHAPGTGELVAARDRSGRYAAVAYVLHFAPAMREARQFLQTVPFGIVHHVAVVTGHDFPAARPGYREIYYRDRTLGGGAIQDALTHLANAVEWCIGPTTQVFCDAQHQMLAGVAVEDTVNVIARNGEVLVSYALNQFQAPHETRLDFHAEGGSVRVELHNQRWGTYSRGAGAWNWHDAPLSDRDQMYLAQANAFLDGADGKPTLLCTLEEGIETLRFNLAALRSWNDRSPVSP